ncbi:MAG TPA: DUF3291 domain-containing protein [Acidimicrobiales bacterium]|jgi:hypothetical protein|nr:DUF3291 domain-containing protein [Acidimicrobiales bacterium]
MPFLVVTRLRLRDTVFTDEFVSAAFAIVSQAQSSEGNLAADALAEANNTYWTRTVWDDHAAMRRFMIAEPHRSTMERIDDWCDEATFVNWDQTESALPDWTTAYRRLTSDGAVVDLPAASAANAQRDFPPPLVSG